MKEGAARSAVARAHPFTPLVLTLAVVALVFLLPAPSGPVTLAIALLLAAPLLSDAGALRPVLLIALPLWILLLVVQGALGDAPYLWIGPARLSAAGMRETVAQGSRLTAIVAASFLLLRGFNASRFVDAAMARRWPFSAAYLLAATLQIVPRLGARIALIRDAQRARGLRVEGSLLTRTRALFPLAFPLIFGALADADDRAISLETRAVAAVAGGGVHRTPLHPPRDTVFDRLLRWLAILAVLAAALWRWVA